jgi:beta-lysine N6-acetyltransferase
MYDTVETIKHSLIQHGPLNNRIYLMSIDHQDHPIIFTLLEDIANNNNYTKIFAKVPEWAVAEAKKIGYVIEAKIPDLFNNSTDGFFLGKFLDISREKIREDTYEEIRRVDEKFQYYTNNPITPSFHIQTDLTLTKLTEDDASTLAKLYGKIFETYPFPIYDESYLKIMMKDHVNYYGIKDGGFLVAASAAEMNLTNRFVEMTDFATLPEKRGNNYAFYLLQYMEQEMKKKKMKTAFTISRAISYGMNITFAKAGYTHAGLLKNNTAIAGNLENMNVLYKKI